MMKAMMAVTDPKSFKEAVAGIDKEAWIEAMSSEMQSLIDHDVFELVPLPKGKKAISCRWHFRTKFKTSGEIDKRKARLVARGFLQQKGIDYNDTFSPSTRQETVRLVLSHIAREAWDSEQMDVMTAFLNSVLKEEVYLKQPEGFASTEKPDWVWRVKASLYGLKHSPRAWNSLLTKELVSFGMVQSPHDPVLFTQRRDGKVVGLVIVHVDDLILAGEKSFMKEMGPKIKSRFKMSKVGPLDTYLSLKIDKEKDGSLLIGQQHYINRIVSLHLPSNAKPAHVPCNSFFADLTRDKESDHTTEPFAELLGMLQWVANGTRPDIQFAVNRLSQFLRRPTDLHWRAAIHVLRYLNTTKSLRLKLGSDKGNSLHGFSDSDWASTTEDRRSTTGWIFRYGGGAVSWKSRRQPTVALSSTEGEYMAISDATREALWLKSVAQDLGVEKAPLTLHFDNQGAGKLSESESLHRRTKHIDVKHHFVRDSVASGDILLKYTPTAEMLADVLTKSLGKTKHEKAVKELGLV